MNENITLGSRDPRSFEERVFACCMDNRVDAGFANIKVDLDEVKARLDGLETRVATTEENAGARFSLVDSPG